MTYFSKDKCSEKKMFLPEKQKNIDAKRNELYRQGYYYELEKLQNGSNEHFRHKPYQCDIKLN